MYRKLFCKKCGGTQFLLLNMEKNGPTFNAVECVNCQCVSESHHYFKPMGEFNCIPSGQGLDNFHETLNQWNKERREINARIQAEVTRNILLDGAYCDYCGGHRMAIELPNGRPVCVICGCSL